MIHSRFLHGKARILLLTVCWLVISSPLIKAQEQNEDSSTKVMIKYGGKGFEFQTADRRFAFQIQSRLQFRFAAPEDQDPVTFDDFKETNTRLFKINRARLKVGGQVISITSPKRWNLLMNGGTVCSGIFLYDTGGGTNKLRASQLLQQFFNLKKNTEEKLFFVYDVI